jgi:hypothetical protein
LLVRADVGFDRAATSLAIWRSVALLLALTFRFELDFEMVFFISPILLGLTIAPPPSRFLPLAFSRAPRPPV